ncbi:hypothetical protein [Pedobacter sp. N23S346]|uniref:hypothetical protein n=1 Tax=Pedobacter sp. N23S346 TaxID=3402750 RepID=UPI003ACDAA39
MSIKINLFYQEPDPDRWILYDRYPRRIIRRLIRGKRRPGGVMMIAIELMKGLDKLGIPYRFNDFNFAKNNPKELIGVIGKPQLIFRNKFKNPILFGSGVFSHPIDCPDLFINYPNVKKILVPGPWMKEMFKPYYGDKVLSWPVGIDTVKWNKKLKKSNTKDFIIYEKFLWNKEHNFKNILEPIKKILSQHKHTYEIIHYGEYSHDELLKRLNESTYAIFLGEHETQGLAYQQILSTDTPILAYDKNGVWPDPSYYPKIIFKPVTSTPYWDDRCGIKFNSISNFETKLEMFKSKYEKGEFAPRDFILENLTLEICAKRYYDIYCSLSEKV